MSYASNTDLALAGFEYESIRLPNQMPLYLQGDLGYTFHPYRPRNTLPARADPVLDSPSKEHPRGSQQLGWYSPPASEYAESLHGDSEEVVLSAGSTAEDRLATPGVEAIVAENAHLRAIVMAMSERVTQLEAAVALKTPPQPQPNRPPTTPHKRRASRVNDPASPKYTPMTPQSMGPIEAMWSPGVTQEQRLAIARGQMRSSTSPAAPMSSPGSIMSPQTSTSSPAATIPKDPTLKQKPATKKTRASRVKKTSVPKKARVSKVRPVSELGPLNFASLGAEEKASILQPLLQGIDPFTGTELPVSAPVPMSMQSEIMPAPSTAISTAGHMTDDEFNALLNFTTGDDIAYNHGQVDHFSNFDAAARQREALEKHERRVTEGRQR
ncbi:hypothetical protein HBI42_070550 [Parastagonospora nodorum]|nr:hypothetical protein HBI43_078160 [Parastagonospora nodorum]KAH6263909.1 hypothetical protein HBI42_070550 [Parastagonospora nodorum]